MFSLTRRSGNWVRMGMMAAAAAALTITLSTAGRAEEAAAAEAEVIAETPTVIENIDAMFSKAVEFAAGYLFYDFGTGMPFVVMWLIAGALFFTLRMGFINLRAFRHAIDVVRGRFDNDKEAGEVTHFQALTSALSATVGLGNIAGVTIAVAMGGAGAVFWMLLAGFFGMTSKFVECTLAQMYRRVNKDGTVSGGPMVYLTEGLKEMGLSPLGRVLGILFAILCIGGCLGGGNMFQANQSFSLIAATVTEATGVDVTPLAWIYGLLLAALVGMVIIGGIKRIGRATSKIVPLMCGIYVIASLFIIFTHIQLVPALIAKIFTEAFTGTAAAGGLVGVLVIGVQRAVFSNEAGIGSAAIAHAAAKTKEPVREGIVALLGPFIDTIVVCLMTALVVLITGVTGDPAYKGFEGAALTSAAFGTVIGWFPYVLSLSVFLFAFSTMISWSYYGEKAWEHLFGRRSTLLFKLLFLVCVFIGAIANLGAVLTFTDIMILCMAFPNILGALLLSGKVKRALSDYWLRYKSGQMEADVAVQPAADTSILIDLATEETS